ncbi:unnamed protein product [Alternaria burnsii]|nr:unnamed protein product [Alternaria burnsii]
MLFFAKSTVYSGSPSGPSSAQVKCLIEERYAQTPQDQAPETTLVNVVLQTQNRRQHHQSSSFPNLAKHKRPTSRYQTLPISKSSRNHLRHPCRQKPHQTSLKLPKLRAHPINPSPNRIQHRL